MPVLANIVALLEAEGVPLSPEFVRLLPGTSASSPRTR